MIPRLHARVPRHVRILLTTGSLRLAQARRRDDRQDEIRLLSPALYGNAGYANALVAHLPGNAGMSWDGHFPVLLEQCRLQVVAFARKISPGAMPPGRRAKRMDE